MDFVRNGYLRKCGSDKKKILRCPKLNYRKWEGKGREKRG